MQRSTDSNEKGMAMNLPKMIPAVLVSLLLATPLWSAPKYGDATIQQGSLTVVRGGKRLQYTQTQGAVPVEEQDLLRVGPQSRVILSTPQKATLTLGSNAVMHVKPWQRREDRGFLRMLFGRVRSTVAQLTGGEQFKMKTATATIGVKGTEFDTTQDSNQNVWTFTREGVVEMTGLQGPPVDINPGAISVVVNGKQASTPAPLPPNMQSTVQNLDAPDASDPAAGDLPGAGDLVESGIVAPTELEESREEPPSGETTTTTTTDSGAETVLETNLDDAQQASAAQRARLEVKFEK